MFINIDATQIEINPLAIASKSKTDSKYDKTVSNKYSESNANDQEIKRHVVCFDCKINVDDNAEFRHPDLFKLEDTTQIDPLEVRARSHGLNYIHMDGDIACIVNGAGLAMATMDILNFYGGKASNFLDLGGRITVEGVTEALNIVCMDKQVYYLNKHSQTNFVRLKKFL